MLRALVRPALALFKGDGDAQLRIPVETDDAPTPPLSPDRTPPVPVPSSPETQSQPQPPLPPRSQREPYNRPTVISEDERRLLPDYDIPPDATIIPPPLAWAYNEEPVMKPGGGKIFSPMNTFDRPRRQQLQKTYGASSKHPRLDGQLAFLDTVNIDPEDSPASKRRKMQSSHVIDIDDDASGPPHRANGACSSPKPPLSVTSRSHRSIEQGSNMRPSSFMQTAELADPHRKRRRRPGVVSNIAPRRLSITTSPRDRGHLLQGADTAHAIDVEGGNESPPRTIAAISRSLAADPNSPEMHRFFQDYSDDELHAESPRTVSKHFTNIHANGTSRIKNSTEDRAETKGPVRAAKASLVDNLRETSRPQYTVETIEDHDELADDAVPLSTVRIDKNGSRSHIPTTATRGKVQITSEPGWPLLYARSHDVKEQGPGLYLTRPSDSKLFELEKHHPDGQAEVLATIDMRKVNSASSDGASRIRVEGPASQGIKYKFDLQFRDKRDIDVFSRVFVEPACRNGKINYKESKWMAQVFSLDLFRSANPHTSSAPSGIMRASDTRRGAQDSDRRPQPRPLLIDQLNPNRDNAEVQELPRTTQKIRASTQNSIASGLATAFERPVRTTRNSRPTHETSMETNHKVVEEPIKFSEAVGLGQRWSKPVQYNTGRHRALVDFDDLLRLDEGEFLNDQLIEFYMIYIFEHAKVPPNKVYFFNTHFYTTLTQPVPGQKGGINYARVARWTAKEDIFNYDYIVVPVCEAAHWYLAIICNVSNISRKPALGSTDSSSPAPTSSAKTEEPMLTSVVNQPSAEQTSHDPSKEQPGEDPNLFDEEQRRRSAPDFDTSQHTELPPVIQRDGEGRESSAEAARMEKLTLEDAIPKGILGDVLSSPPSSKKGRRKSGRSNKKYPPDEPIIIVLDSLGLSHPNTVRALKDYILEEGRAKRSMEAVITQNAFYVREAHIPMQPNFTDCGVYLLGYLQKFFNNPRDFVTRILTREMDPQTDWPDMRAPKIRAAMRDILMKLAEQQGAVKKKKKPAADKEQLPEDPKPRPASPILAPSTDVPPAPANSTIEEKSSKTPLSAPADNDLVPEDPKARLASPSQPEPSNAQPTDAPSPTTNLAVDEKKSTNMPLKTLERNDPLPECQKSRLASPIRLVPSTKAPQPLVIATADDESKTTPRRPSPKVVVHVQSPAKPLKRPLDDLVSHAEAESSGRPVESEPASSESTPKRLKTADRSKTTLRLSKSPARSLQSAKAKDDIHALPESSSPCTSGTKSSHRTPRRSERGSSANPIEIDDSQETIERRSPRLVRERPSQKDAVEVVAESSFWKHSLKGPSRSTAKPPGKSVEQQSPKISRPGQSSLAAMERGRRKHQSEDQSRTAARLPGETGRQQSPSPSRHRQPSVEEIEQPSVAQARATARPSTHRHRGEASPGSGSTRSTQPASRIRRDRDSPEVPESPEMLYRLDQESDTWSTRIPRHSHPRSGRIAIPESPPPTGLDGFPADFGVGIGNRGFRGAEVDDDDGGYEIRLGGEYRVLGGRVYEPREASPEPWVFD